MIKENVTMYPEDARDLLTRNDNNRGLAENGRYVKHLADMMAKGLWIENGESIKLLMHDKIGYGNFSKCSVIDGQHRPSLRSCRRSFCYNYCYIRQ